MTAAIPTKAFRAAEASASAAEVFSALQQGRLSNDLRFLLWPSPRLPVSQISWVAPAGSWLDPPGKEGLATVTFLAAAQSETLRDLSTSAAVVPRSDWHTGSLSLACLSRDLECLLPRFLEGALAPSFDERALARAKSRCIGELKGRRWSPGYAADQALAGSTYGDHRYGRPRRGSLKSLQSIDLGDVERFYREAVATRGSVWIAAGDLSADRLRSCLDQEANPLPEAPQPELPDSRALPEKRDLVLVDHPRAQQAELRFGFRIPPLDDPSFVGFWMLATLLGGSARSRLNQLLREELGLTYQVRCGIEARLGVGLFVIGTAVDRSRVREAVEGVERVLSHDSWITEADLDYAARRLTGILLRSLQTVAGQTRQLSRLVTRGLPQKYFETYVRRLHSNDRGDLRDLAATFLRPENATVVVAGAASLLREQLSDWRAGTGIAVEASAPTRIRSDGHRHSEAGLNKRRTEPIPAQIERR